MPSARSSDGRLQGAGTPAERAEERLTRRSERVAEEIREETARIIGSQLKDPRIGFVTVTRVEVTPDLRFARIHVGVLGDEVQRERTLKGLRKAAGFVRREIGKRLRMRHTPELQFEYDEGLDASDRVAQLLRDFPPREIPDDADEPDEPGEPGEPDGE